MPATNETPQPLSELQLKDIETAVLSRYYDTIIQNLENDRAGFNDFKAMEFIEFHARALSEDYLTKLSKNLITFNEQMDIVAKKYANKRSNYEVIKQAKARKEFQRNDRMFEMLLKMLKDCQHSAFILATHRSKAREHAVHEQLLSGNSIILQNTAHIPQIQQNITLILERMELNPAQPAAQQYRQEVQPNVEMDNQHRELLAQNATGPQWIVPQEDCQSLSNSSISEEVFVRAYLQKLFNLAELLQPLSEVSATKQTEAKNVFKFFYGTHASAHWEEVFEKIMKSIRTNKRHQVFKKINNTKIGYGITNSGLFEFYFKSPIGNNMDCFSNPQCIPSSRLSTKLVGNFKVPRTCGDFDYVVLIEKQDRYAKFNKLLSDGRMMQLRN